MDNRFSGLDLSDSHPAHAILDTLNADTSARFSGIEIDDKPAALAPGIVSATPALQIDDKPAARVSSTWENPVHNAEGQARAERVDALVRGAGFAFTEQTLYAWGTEVLPDSARRLRVERHERPLAKAALKEVICQIESERRVDSLVRLSELVVDDQLRVKASSKVGAGIGMTELGAQHLLQMAGSPRGAASYLTAPHSLPGAQRAAHINHWLTSARDRSGEPKAARMLSKVDSRGGGRHVYAVVSESYGRHDLDAVAREIMNGSLPSDARASIAYDPATTRWNIDVNVGIEFAPVVGDVHQLGLRISGSDAKQAAISIEWYAERIRCLNCTVIQSVARRGRVRHMGASVGERVAALLNDGDMHSIMQQFSDVMREANVTAIVEEGLARSVGAEEIAAALVDGGYVDISESRDQVIQALVRAYEREPMGNTAYSWHQAMTRAAHEGVWSNPWTTQELESQASAFVYRSPVLTATDFASL